MQADTRDRELLQTEEPAAPGHFPLGSEQMRILPHPEPVNYLNIFILQATESWEFKGSSLWSVRSSSKQHRLGQLLQPTLSGFGNRGSPRMGISPDFLRKKEQQHFVMRTEGELLKCPRSCLKGDSWGPCIQQGSGDLGDHGHMQDSFS